MRNQKEYRRRLLNFLPFDHDGIENYLEKQAQEGWQLDHIGGYFWYFRREKPTQVHYHVVQLPEVSAYDPEDTPASQRFDDYCREAGWIRVDGGAGGKMMIYASQEADPVPIDTDEHIRLESIQRSMRTSLLPLWILLIICLGLNVRNVFSEGSYYFGIPGLLSKIAIVSGLLLMVTSLLFYFLWLARSRKSVAEGGACASTGLYGRLFSLFTWFVVTVTVLCVLASICKPGGLSLVGLLVAIAVLLLNWLVRRNSIRMRRKGISRQKNMLVTTGILLLGMVIIFGTAMAWVFFSVMYL